MLTLKLGTKTVRVDPQHPLGQGGEACVYDLGDGRVLKVFRDPADPTLALEPGAADAARKRIATHQEKLPAFPRGLPARVVAPQELARDKSGQIIGYAAPLVRGAEVLLRYSQPKFRQSVPQADVLPVLLDLHATVGQVHTTGVVIGDFNDQNVLVRGHEAWLIDADSMQYGRWPCVTYTTRFVDPLCCTASPATGEPTLTKPHTPASDWYAFTCMVVHTFLWTDVYGGTYTPPPGGPKVKHGARVMHRIPVWHKDVRYPKPAFPFGLLPDDLMQHFHAVFEQDQRGVFPVRLLDQMRWTTCASCGATHARAQCPTAGCATAAAAVRPVTQTTQVRGNVTATVVYQGGGVVVRCESHAGKVRWLVHDVGYRREDGTVVLHGPLDRRIRFRLAPAATYVALGTQVAKLDVSGKSVASVPVQPTDGVPVFGANASHLFWIDQDQLYRSDDGVGVHDLGPVRIGPVFGGQTRFWVGEKFGFGFYRAAAYTRAFVFTADRGSLNDRVPVQIRGKLLDATCAIAGGRAWFFTVTQEGPRTVHRCTVIDDRGNVLATAEGEPGDDSWLGGIRGGAATSNGMLLMPTDAGIVRVEALADPYGKHTLEATRFFPDTEPFVDSGCRLVLGSDGLYVVSADSRRVTRLVIR